MSCRRELRSSASHSNERFFLSPPPVAAGIYLRIHEWFDASKAMMADLRHRALRHHAEGILLCEQIFGAALANSDGRVIPTRWIGEQHVREDLGWIRSMQDWFKHIRPEKWMRRAGALEEQPAAKSSAASTS